MKTISRDAHGTVDCLIGMILVLLPFFGSFPQESSAVVVTVAFGLGLMVIALLTDFLAGYVKVIPYPVHLGLDLLIGLSLAAAPWFFGFAGISYLPHLLFGALIFGHAVVALEHLRPGLRPHFSAAHEPRDFHGTWSEMNHRPR